MPRCKTCDRKECRRIEADAERDILHRQYEEWRLLPSVGSSGPIGPNGEKWCGPEWKELGRRYDDAHKERNAQRKACRENAVDWRARCLRAESELKRRSREPPARAVVADDGQ